MQNQIIGAEMKTLIKKLFIVLLFLTIPTVIFAEEAVRITNGEWEPYLSEHLKFYGVGSRIVSEAFALQGIRVEYGFFPWPRAYNLAKTGKWDGVVCWGYSPQEKEGPKWVHEFYASDSLYEDKDVFFHLKSYPFDWKTPEDLYGIPMGGIISYAYNIIRKDIDAGRIKMEVVPKEIHNFKKLLAGRIKIYPENFITGNHILNTNFSPEMIQLITHNSKPLRTMTYHLILSMKSKKSKRLIHLFNKGLKRLKESGKYDQYFMESQRGDYIIKK